MFSCRFCSYSLNSTLGRAMLGNADEVLLIIRSEISVTVKMAKDANMNIDQIDTDSRVEWRNKTRLDASRSRASLEHFRA
ncbi:unnamed protein product [Periconia digitata]|uniref:Uncharacterized protein n=1 Tax=Periconia digitata TaxID=1303443 RepID=A0A9W4UES1_9PLEO|nr:unnamed protein product [Periconia digitata]